MSNYMSDTERATRIAKLENAISAIELYAAMNLTQQAAQPALAVQSPSAPRQESTPNLAVGNSNPALGLTPATAPDMNNPRNWPKVGFSTDIKDSYAFSPGQTGRPI